jgi:hypothetical protein
MLVLNVSRTGRRRRSLSQIAAIPAEVQMLEKRELLSVTQTVTVKNASTGAPLANANVAVTDGFASYAPVHTNSLGQVKITTNGGIRTVTTYRDGFAPTTVTINQSASNYTTSLKPLASTAFKDRMSSIAMDAWAIAKLVGTPRYLGQATVSQVLSSTILASAGVTSSCYVASYAVVTAPVTGPCIIAGASVFTATSAAQAIYNSAVDVGLTQNRLLNFYYVPVLNQIFVAPAK